MPQTTSVDTLIIGAGVAGLNAACKLAEKDQNDFLVLEADDRIGGRVKTTTTVQGNVINDGAHWVHPIDGSVDHNPVMHDLSWFDLPAIMDGNAHLDIIWGCTR